MIEGIYKFGMCIFLAGTAPPVGGDMTGWAQFGVAGLVVGFVLWRDNQREIRMSKSMDAQNKWMREQYDMLARRGTPPNGIQNERLDK